VPALIAEEADPDKMREWIDWNPREILEVRR
jgi:hypothetical protein